MDSMVTVVPIAFFIFMFLLVVVVARIISDNRVRTRALENNATPEVMAALMAPRREEALSSALKWGIVVTLLAIAFIVVGQFRLDEYSDALAFGVILLAPGLGLLLYYGIAKRRSDREHG